MARVDPAHRLHGVAPRRRDELLGARPLGEIEHRLGGPIEPNVVEGLQRLQSALTLVEQRYSWAGKLAPLAELLNRP